MFLTAQPAAGDDTSSARVSKTAQMARAPDKERIPSLNGMSILIVESDILIADRLADAIVSLGALTVGPAITTADALSLLVGKTVDAGVIDIRLENEFAYPVIDRLVAAGSPVVIATSYPAHMFPSQYRHLPRWAKPYVPISLAYALKAIRRR